MPASVFDAPSTIDVDEHGYRLDAHEIDSDSDMLRIMQEEEAAAEAAEAARRAAPYARGFDTPGSGYSAASYRSLSARRRSVFSPEAKEVQTPRARSTGRRGTGGGHRPPYVSPPYASPQHPSREGEYYDSGYGNEWGDVEYVEEAHSGVWGGQGGEMVPPPPRGW